MKYLDTITRCSRTIFRYNGITLYRCFSTYTKIIEDISQLDKQLDDMRSSEGLVVLINGASSCGKSTLSRYLFTKGYTPYSFDQTYRQLWLENLNSHSKTDISDLAIDAPNLIEDIWKEYFGFKVDWNMRYKSDEIVQIARNALKLAPSDLHDQIVYDRIFTSARPILQNGGVISVDAVFDAESLLYFGHSFSRGSQSFAYVLRYESVLENIKRAVGRNTKAIDEGNADFRNPGMVLDNFRDLYNVKSPKEVAENGLVIDELKIKDIKTAIQLIKGHTDFLAVELFDSEEKQKEFVDGVYSSIHLFNEFIEQSGGLCVVAKSNIDFVVKVDLLGEM